MTPHENSELFIEEYLKLVEEREQSEFQKILEMKVLESGNLLFSFFIISFTMATDFDWYDEKLVITS